MLDSAMTYELPTPEDKEGLTVTIKTALIRSEPLPSFIKYQNGIYTFNPVLPKDAGMYQIEVILSDGYAQPRSYFFKLNVVDPTKAIASMKSKEDRANFTVN